MKLKNKFLNQFEFPSLVQWSQILMLSTYLIIAWMYLGILRPQRFYLAAIFGIFFDLFLNSLPRRRTSDGKIKFPLTGFVVGTAIAIILESNSVWMYFIAVILAVSSKSLIQINKRHVFNPANFGVACVLLLFSGRATVNTAQWSGAGWVLIIMFALGLTQSILAKRYQVSISYLFFFFVFSAAFSIYKGLPMVFMPGSLLGISTVLFAFHMITDPVTCPPDSKTQILLGVAIAFFDIALRSNRILYAQLISLLIVLALNAAFKKDVDERIA